MPKETEDKLAKIEREHKEMQEEMRSKLAQIEANIANSQLDLLNKVKEIFRRHSTVGKTYMEDPTHPLGFTPVHIPEYTSAYQGILSPVCLTIENPHYQTGASFPADCPATSGLKPEEVIKYREVVESFYGFDAKVLTLVPNMVLPPKRGKEGIKRQFTVANTSQQNGVVERMNKTLLERTRAMLRAVGQEKSFWAESVNTACYLVNQAPSTAMELKTPMEMWTGPNKDYIEELKAQLAREFEMKDLRSSNKILGIMSPSSEEERMKMSRVSYALAMGSLMFYMICKRLDIAQAVGVVSRYMANPDKEHWNTSVVATSTTEAEYVAATQASKEAIWLKILLEELRHNQEYVSLFCDSQSALHLARNPTFHSRTKRIRVQYHFIREKVEEGTVDMQKIHTKDNIADFMTKAVNVDKFTWCRSSCGLSETGTGGADSERNSIEDGICIVNILGFFHLQSNQGVWGFGIKGACLGWFAYDPQFYDINNMNFAQSEAQAVQARNLKRDCYTNLLVRGIKLDSGIPLQWAAKVPMMITFYVIDRDGEENDVKSQACIFKVVPNTRSRSQMGETTDGGLHEIFQHDFGPVGSPSFEAARSSGRLGYLASRRYTNGIINTVLLMLDSGLLCFSRGDPTGNLRKRFHPEMSEQEAANFMKSVCVDACNKWTTAGHDLIQYLQQGIEK
ncbi:putative carboxylesterase 5-like [Hibiscus syriacus]|uniref:Carboxylesterase 5-like n=1 Tax=Hibiscus syriacus TaxID=106335 RepID=A0A6A3BJM8_HIBSY|nr:putative carboxylesterase 5-like [Hibiscus syriacus]